MTIDEIYVLKTIPVQIHIIEKNNMESVTLKNGSSELKAVVIGTFISLEQLLNSGNLTDVMSLYELVQISRNPQHKIFSQIQVKRLQELGLLRNDGTIHSSIRNVVLSSVVGEGFELSLQHPIAN